MPEHFHELGTSPQPAVTPDQEQEKIEEYPKVLEDLLDNRIQEVLLEYEPFDPDTVIRRIRVKGVSGDRERGVTGTEDSRQERLKINQHRLERFKGLLHLQKEGIQSVIREIIDYARSHSHATISELFTMVERNAPLYYFSEKQLYRFAQALERYEERHAIVQDFVRSVETPEEAYERCFAKMPEEKVAVEIGPMTIHFRCFGTDDYVYAYAGHGTYTDVNGIPEEKKQQAQRTLGFAILDAPATAPGLAGGVTVENASKKSEVNPTYEKEDEPLPTEISVQIDLFSVEKILTYQGNKTVIFIHTPVGSFEIFFEYSKEASHMCNELSDVVVHKHIAHDDIFEIGRYSRDIQHGIWKNENEKRYLTRRTLRAAIPRSFLPLARINQAQEGCSFTVNANGIVTIKNNSTFDMEVEYQKEQSVVVIRDHQLSQSIKDHEEQHHINALFRTWGGGMSAELLESEISMKAESIEQAKEMLIKQNLRWERRSSGINKKAREEILCFCRDGTEPDQIERNLLTAKSYQYVERLNINPVQVGKDITQSFEHDPPIFLFQTGESFSPSDITPEEIEHYFDTVFRDEYAKDIHIWCEAVALLDSKGYSRDEVLYFLYQEPAQKWLALARRMEPKQDVSDMVE